MIGGVASFAGIGWTFGAVAIASFGLVAWAAVIPAPSGDPAQRHGRTPSRGATTAGCSSPRGSSSSPRSSSGPCRVLAPLRLAALGFGALAIGAVFLCAAAFESGQQRLRRPRLRPAAGRSRPIKVGLVASIVVAALLPWPRQRLRARGARRLRRRLVRHLLHARDDAGLESRRGARPRRSATRSALVNLAWAPGQTLGAAGGGALALRHR